MGRLDFFCTSIGMTGFYRDEVDQGPVEVAFMWIQLPRSIRGGSMIKSQHLRHIEALYCSTPDTLLARVAIRLINKIAQLTELTNSIAELQLPVELPHD